MRGVLPLVLLLSACGDPATSGGEVPGAADAPTATVDWAARTGSLETPEWALSFCEGEGPFLCVLRDGRYAGAVELLRFPVASYDVLRETLQRGGSEREALEAASAELLATLEADRRTGFGADYRVVGDEPAPVPVGGKPGLRSGFRGMLGERVMERVIQYRVIARDTLFLLSATASESGGGGPSEGEFSLESLEAFAGVFDRLAAASRFGGPRP